MELEWSVEKSWGAAFPYCFQLTCELIAAKDLNSNSSTLPLPSSDTAAILTFQGTGKAILAPCQPGKIPPEN